MPLEKCLSRLFGKFLLHLDPGLFKEFIPVAFLGFLIIYFILYVMLLLSLFQDTEKNMLGSSNYILFLIVLYFVEGASGLTVAYADDDDSTAFDSMSAATNKIQKLTTSYRNELTLLGTNDFLLSVDEKLIAARERGPGEFSDCLANVQLER
jgi:hypothetical protein